LVKAQSSRNVRVRSFGHDHAVCGSTPGTKSSNSDFHVFEVGKRVATFTDSELLLFEKIADLLHREIYMVCVTLHDISGSNRTTLPSWAATISTRQDTHVHTYMHIHNIWWLALRLVRDHQGGLYPPTCFACHIFGAL